MKNKYISTDGNSAAAKVAYALSDMAVIYPITPSSSMAELVDEMSAAGTKNIFGNVVDVREMQSEGGAAGALHGALACGSLATTFTSSQGLLLMLPNMFKIAGELLPCVIHVAARTVATHALSIFGDHSDVMSARNTGFAILCSSSVEEAQDMALASHLATVDARVPFLHFFDGFRTSHEINKIEEIDIETIKKLADTGSINAFRATALSPDSPTQRGTSQSPDVFFQNREASNSFYMAVPEILEKVFKKTAKATGRKYNLFDYEGPADATEVICAMGSACETISETLKFLNKAGEKVGLLKVRLFRPFSFSHFWKALPKTIRKITVLDRTKESGAPGEPLYLDITCAVKEKQSSIEVIGGRYGLSGKEFTPSMVLAVLKNMQKQSPKNHFTVGINDDVTFTSLSAGKKAITLPKGTIECKFFGLGSDGTVSANKNSIKIIGDNTPLFTQGYFEYDSRKAGGLTVSHLRFGKEKIQAAYLCTSADFIACHNPTYVQKFNVLEGIKRGGTFLLNAPWGKKELEKELPDEMKNELADKNISFYVIDASKIANDVKMTGRINLIMQTAFFAISKIFPLEKGISLIKEFARKSYAKKGEQVLAQNMQAIDKSTSAIKKVEVPATWKTKPKPRTEKESDNYFKTDIMDKMERREGDEIPVSAFAPNGEVPLGTTAFEKRKIATFLPKWIAENCIQCNQCSLVCPHGVIRPYLIKSGSKKPSELKVLKALGVEDHDFFIQISPRDCTGCGNCANVCPAIKKALEMTEIDQIFEEESKKYEFAKNLENPEVTPMNVRTSQFKKPLLEFSGACAGCGETPYVKLLTQLFGEKLTIANATGCTSIWGGTFPVCPYAKAKSGKGPAWSNSLFEDNAEFGYGMYLAHKNTVALLEKQIEQNQTNKNISGKLKGLLEDWKNGERTVENQNKILVETEKELGKTADTVTQEFSSTILAASNALTEKSFWIIGGDGWAYDIGFGGLDHVLCSGEKLRVLVLDTELYSNTGGQCSKASPMGSVIKFAASGKTTHKKDLSLIALNYPNTYVATISLGANMAQTLKAFEEAEAHDGPALLIAYAPCINQGVDMTKTSETMKSAVTSGYFPLFRHNPVKTPSLTLDPPQATGNYEEFLKKQTRYNVLEKANPAIAKELFEKASEHAKARIEKIKRLAKPDSND